jgi:hypothetical protein
LASVDVLDDVEDAFDDDVARDVLDDDVAMRHAREPCGVGK